MHKTRATKGFLLAGTEDAIPPCLEPPGSVGLPLALDERDLPAAGSATGSRHVAVVLYPCSRYRKPWQFAAAKFPNDALATRCLEEQSSMNHARSA